MRTNVRAGTLFVRRIFLISSRVLFDSKSGSEEFVALFFEHAANNLALTECTSAGEFLRSDVERPPVQGFQEGNRRTKNDSANSGPRNRTLAHRTWLGRGVKRQL